MEIQRSDDVWRLVLGWVLVLGHRLWSPAIWRLQTTYRLIVGVARRLRGSAVLIQEGRAMSEVAPRVAADRSQDFPARRLNSAPPKALLCAGDPALFCIPLRLVARCALPLGVTTPFFSQSPA